MLEILPKLIIIILCHNKNLSDDTLWVSVPPVAVPYYLKILVISLTANHQNFLWVHLCLSLLFLLFQFSSVSFVEFHHALYNNNNFPHILNKNTSYNNNKLQRCIQKLIPSTFCIPKSYRFIRYMILTALLIILILNPIKYNFKLFFTLYMYIA